VRAISRSAWRYRGGGCLDAFNTSAWNRPIFKDGKQDIGTPCMTSTSKLAALVIA